MPDDHTRAPDAPSPKRLPVWPEGVRCETCGHWTKRARYVEGMRTCLAHDEIENIPVEGFISTGPTFACNQWKEKP